MRKKFPVNQLFLDFSYRQDRLVLIPEPKKNIEESKEIFNQLTKGNLNLHEQDVISADLFINQLNTNLAYPETINIAQLHNTTANFKGFATIFEGCGWVFINANGDVDTKNYYSYLLTACMGMKSLYPDKEKLVRRSEELVFINLLPEDEVRSFFSDRINNISPVIAADISHYFHVPFDIVLKRALLLNIISDKQFEMFMPISRIAPSAKPQTELYISNEDYVDPRQLNLFD